MTEYQIPKRADQAFDPTKASIEPCLLFLKIFFILLNEKKTADSRMRMNKNEGLKKRIHAIQNDDQSDLNIVTSRARFLINGPSDFSQHYQR